MKPLALALLGTLLAVCLLAGAPRDDARTHWAFQPPRRPAEPALRDSGWVRNPIDGFVLERLERAGLRPAPEADRATLIRRLSLDLLGIPPSLTEVDEFVHDPRPDAYERVADRLLASPHYGERWGRHWLDLARYADSNGYTIDGARSIWKYRDWVIDALNRDLPFDQFTICQIAGDMLPGATVDQQIATGFHRNTLRNEEGGTDQEQFRIDAVADRLNTTGAVFLGLTVGCARCHDHKYDPISQREYYQMFALLNNADEPTLSVPTSQQAKESPALIAEIAEAEKRLAMVDENSATRQAAWERLLTGRRDVEWTVLDPIEFRSRGGATIRKLADGSLLVAGTIPERDTYTVVAGVPPGDITAVRLEALTDDSLPRRGPGLAANGNFVLSEFSVRAGGDPVAGEQAAQVLEITQAVADHSQAKYPIEAAADKNPQTGWAINTADGKLNTDRTAVFVLAASPPAPAGDAEPADGRRWTFTLEQQHAAARYSIGRLRLSVTNASRDVVRLPPDVRAALAIAPAERSDEEQKRIAAEFRKTDSERMPVAARVAELKQLHEQLKASVTTTLVMRERAEPRETYVHFRGDFLRPGERVEPAVPAALPPLEPAGTAPNRLDLARWLVDPRNPLTARVTINRIWQRHFGAGLVATENDFGSQGERPTHPELLDWLATEFMARGWSLKAMHRLIVTSASYRQSSRFRADLHAVDPNNKLLGRQARLRLEAEVIRDVALSAGGLLATEIGGPGVYPPQPEGVYRFTQVPKYWKEVQGPDRYRRGMYTYFWRSSPQPFLTTFDAPDGNVTCTRRVRSNTPLQALTLANDRAFFEIAQALAARVLREAPVTDDQRIRHAFRLCLAREPQEGEASQLTRFLAAERAQRADPAAESAPRAAAEPRGDGSPEDTAAWVALARVLLNLDEFITRE